MTHTAYFDVANSLARAALTGTGAPALSGKLLTHLKLIARCFVGDTIVTVDTGTAAFLILAKTSASGEASLIDTTAVLDDSDPDEPEYVFEWNPADSIQLRAVLDAAADPTQPVELRYEFRFERSGNKGCIGGPIYFQNNFFRPETEAPEATLNSSWTTLKARIVAGDNVTLDTDDDEQTITINAAASGSGSGDVSGPASATNGALALYDGTTGKLLKVGGVPGGAALLNVGSIAGTVAAGDDARLSDARTPTAHTHLLANITDLPASLCLCAVSADGIFLEFRNLAGVLIGKCLLNA